MNHPNMQASPKKKEAKPQTLTTYGSTVFKFNRSEKKWKEKGSGDVTFSLKLKSSGAEMDQLIVSVGKLSFVVQGGVRPKGSKAIVMRGKEVRDTQGEAIILAVRFEHERDSRNLFQMLANTPWIRPQRSAKKPSRPSRGKSRRSGKSRPPPNWFLGMGTREQENIRALVSNAQIAYLEDGTIQRQLATIYKLTAQKIDEAIDFFQPWVKLGAAAGGGSSIGTRTDVSSLPSIHTGKLDYAKQSRSGRPMAPLQRRIASPKGPLNAAPLGSYPKPSPDPPPDGYPEQKDDEPNGSKPPPSPGNNAK